ncbi:hypothetical protein Tco_1444474 [Tanacetum coccineum]
MGSSIRVFRGIVGKVSSSVKLDLSSSRISLTRWASAVLLVQLQLRRYLNDPSDLCFLHKTDVSRELGPPLVFEMGDSWDLLSLGLDFFLLALSLVRLRFSNIFDLLRRDGSLPLGRPF